MRFPPVLASALLVAMLAAPSTVGGLPTLSCEIPQSDADSGRDAADDPREADPVLPVAIRTPRDRDGDPGPQPQPQPQPARNFDGLLFTPVTGNGLDRSDNYLLDVPQELLNDPLGLGEPFELMARVGAVPGASVRVTLYGVHSGHPMPLAEGLTGPGGAVEVRALIEDRFDAFVLGVDADARVDLGDRSPCGDKPGGSLDPCSLGLCVGTSAKLAGAPPPWVVVGNDPITGMGIVMTYDGNVTGCKPRC